MLSRDSSLLLFLFSFLITSFGASAQNFSLIQSHCRNLSTTNISRNITFLTNRRTLFASLSSSDASSYSTGFQNATAGEAPDITTGLFLCRGDVTTEVCRNCVALAVNDTLRLCPNEREAVIYYDDCMLRYSERNILSTLSYNAPSTMWNGNISSNQNQIYGYEDLVSSAMNKAAVEAANSSRKFCAMKADSTALQTLYVLTQCTPDLTRVECLSCLQNSINEMPLYRTGARFLYPSCNSRYELYVFYNETAITKPPPLLPPVSTPPPVSSPPRPGKGGISNVLVVAIVVPITVTVVLFIAGYCFLAKRAKKTSGPAAPAFDGDDITTIESLQLGYKIIQAATNNFSENNKIGQGGFGEVFKGTLSNGTDVAVKRLSKSSGQGDTEFKNEVVLVAKLQHRNLVKIFGFSIEREERILVYEYVPNKSLDYFLFDPEKQGELDWTRRYMIIGGIARGILYLHQDSRLTIIHRDLKAGNILLDEDMNPKIADFGMARIFGMDETQASTSVIVGTFGYMSPEYAIHGQFSVKSDVYSFGVLVLEIISGKKNDSFYDTDGAHDLVTYAWKLWSKGTPLDLVDPIVIDNCQKSEVVRCIHIGLLCVQEDLVERPIMSTIFVMLTSNTVTLPMPQQPGFFVQKRPESDQCVSGSVDDAPITDLYPR
ncbi:PREDICTED: cysteine-rich receptor-like protein kinase 15 isoform X2 [Camelina sativa]|uniref:Cysteine-rich receptor-like protein kinase 15 isoform X2 n=1 Tax=Camelina sativa TaxID=90675 RepID=A0ABM0UZX0_CAMSA|nr:PREDICTED: cysteine-rich receptor-like protein kinase 15 isoform X2 [Camelina sativa]